MLPASPGICLRIAEHPGGFEVQVNQRPAASARTLDDAALLAVKALDDVLIHSIAALRAVHAGAVLIDGRALLIPGSTHAGKSSLVAELLRRGASHFSDEYALIDSTGRVHSYPRPLLLRNGCPSQSLVLPQELGAEFAGRPAPIGSILAVNYVPGGEWQIDERSQGEAVMLLLRNTPHEMSQSPEMIEFFLRAAAGAVCWEGQRGDVADAATELLRLIRRT